MSLVDYFLIPLSPLIALVVAGILLIVLECFKKPVSNQTKLFVALLGPMASAGMATWLSSTWPIAYSSVGYSGSEVWLREFCRAYQLDRLSLSLIWGISVFSFLGVVFASGVRKLDDIRGELFALLQFIAVGMMCLVTARNLLMVFVGLELMSLPTYVLVGIRRDDRQSLEAGMKYFLFGSFATVLLLLGTVLLYSHFQSTDLVRIGELLAIAKTKAEAPPVLVLSGIACILISVTFKVGLVPFHMWLPDVYQGAPTAVTGFMGSAVKLAGFGLVMRLFWIAFLPLQPIWGGILDWLAVISMFVGNIAAVIQPNLKRMFAYSSIAHAGYLMLGVSAVAKTGDLNSSTLVYYLMVYGLMFLGAFGVFSILEDEDGITFENIAGFGFKHAFIGGCLAFFALSAAGIPPTPGFFAKYFVFLDAVSAGKTLWVVLAVISSAIGLFYYLKVLVYLYMKDAPAGGVKVSHVDRTIYLGILGCAIAMAVFALFPHRLGV